MTISSKLKAESLRLRKERSPIAASITFVLSEIEKVGKNNGNRETTNDEATKVVQKVVATLHENLQYNLTDNDRELMIKQIAVLESVLPQMASEEEVTEALLNALGDTRPANKGVAMKVLKDKFGARVDMKAAGTIVSKLYSL